MSLLLATEEKEKRERAEQDKKLAIQMAVCIEHCLDSIRPICKMITELVKSFIELSLISSSALTQARKLTRPSVPPKTSATRKRLSAKFVLLLKKEEGSSTKPKESSRAWTRTAISLPMPNISPLRARLPLRNTAWRISLRTSPAMSRSVSTKPNENWRTCHMRRRN